MCLCSAPPSAGLGQWFEEKYYPFSLLAFSLGNYAAEMHKDTKDVGMGFISWYLSGIHNWFVTHLRPMCMWYMSRNASCHGVVTGSGTPPTGDVFQFPDHSLTFTPRHGSMVAFQPSQLTHGTRVSDNEGEGCQRIGLAIAMQRRAMNVAIAEHAQIKCKQAGEQQLKIAQVIKRHEKGVDRNGKQLKRARKASQ